MLLLLVLALSLIWQPVVAKHCNARDARIYKNKGYLFPSAFRALGGMTVSHSEYAAGVSQAMGLSASCAECYADAYICGYNHCFWSCSTAGTSCDSCLVKEGCIETCNKCTGF